MKLRPIGNKVVVRRAVPESVTAGGIILPDCAQEKQAHGTVVAVGPGKLAEDGVTRLPIALEVGDEVVINKYGQEHDIDGDKLMVMDADHDVLAVVWD